MKDDLRARVALGCNILAMEGHGDINLGHVSARAAGADDYWIKWYGIGLDEVTVEDLLLVDLAGNVLEGARKAHRELPIHGEIFKRRPDICCVIHTHPPFCTAFSTLRQPLYPISHEGVLFARGLPVFEETSNVIETREQGERVAEVLGDGDALLLYNHGVVVVGRTVEEAIIKAVFLEKAVYLHFLATSMGTPRILESEAELLAKRNGLAHMKNLDNTWDYFVRKLERHRSLGRN